MDEVADLALRTYGPNHDLDAGGAIPRENHSIYRQVRPAGQTTLVS
jgi:hypothetical protein